MIRIRQVNCVVGAVVVIALALAFATASLRAHTHRGQKEGAKGGTGFRGATSLACFPIASTVGFQAFVKRKPAG